MAATRATAPRSCSRYSRSFFKPFLHLADSRILVDETGTAKQPRISSPADKKLSGNAHQGDQPRCISKPIKELRSGVGTPPRPQQTFREPYRGSQQLPGLPGGDLHSRPGALPFQGRFGLPEPRFQEPCVYPDSKREYEGPSGQPT